MKTNIFIVGQQVTGESFFGRKRELQNLGRDVFLDHTSLHLVGAPRMGKSSLAKHVLADHREDKNCLLIYIDMGECDSAYDFWKEFCDELRLEIKRGGLWSETFEGFYKDLDKLNAAPSGWYNPMRRTLKKILREIGEQGWHLVVAIDEFDAVTGIFNQTTAYYQLLRSIFSDPVYATNGFLISRRTLPMLEKRATHVSSFANVFPPSGRLRGFNGDDMEEFYAALAQYHISLNAQGRERLLHYTGSIPFLCCMFARHLVQQKQGDAPVDLGSKEIDDARSMLTEGIRCYYDSLIERLREDQQLEPLLTILYVKGRPVNSSDRDELFAMGILQQDETQYFAYSHDFTTYLGLFPLNLPTWDLIISVEQKLKKLLKRVYPELGEDSYKNPTKQEDIENKYGLGIGWKLVDRNLLNLRPYMTETPALAGLGLSFVVDVIIKNKWENFSMYFKNDSDWKDRLDLIREVRNPLFHGQEAPLSEQQLAACNQYCVELLRLDFGEEK